MVSVDLSDYVVLTGLILLLLATVIGRLVIVTRCRSFSCELYSLICMMQLLGGNVSCG